MPWACHPRTSHGSNRDFRSGGAARHWLHRVSVDAPLVIGEALKDAHMRWTPARGAAVGAAIVSEALWTRRVSEDRKREEE
jgi:hypothetical protein